MTKSEGGCCGYCWDSSVQTRLSGLMIRRCGEMPSADLRNLARKLATAMQSAAAEACWDLKTSRRDEHREDG